MYAGRHQSFLGSVLAEVAKVCGDGYVDIKIFITLEFHRSKLAELYTPFTGGDIMLLFASYLANVTASTKPVVDE